MTSERLVLDRRWVSWLLVISAFFLYLGAAPLGVRTSIISVSSEVLSPGSSPISAYGAVLVGCEGVSLSGSGLVDSWDSRDGLYSESLARDNTLIATISPGSDLSISGAATIRGDLLTTRDLLISNGQLISGNYAAARDIIFSNNPPCPLGVVQAGGTISTPGQWWEDECGGVGGWQEGSAVLLPPSQCDPLDISGTIAGLVAEYMPVGGAVQWPHSGWRPSPVHIGENSSYKDFKISSGAHPVTIDGSVVDYLFIEGDFELTSSGEFHIQNPLGAGVTHELMIIVDGDFITGGATTLSVDRGLSVRVYVTGDVVIGGGAAQDIAPSIVIDGKIQPTFGIYASKVAGVVDVTNDAPLTAVVYAPYTDVEVGGSGEVFGAVRGRTIAVHGSGKIHYDESLIVHSSWDGGPIFQLSDLSIGLVADRTEVAFNDEISLQVTLYGGEFGLFEDISVGIELPSELLYLSHHAPSGTSFIDTDADGIPDTWLVDEILAEETRILEIQAGGPNLPDSMEVLIEVQIRAWSGSPDGDPGNNEGSIAVGILPSPLLTVTKAASLPEITPGKVIGYTTSLSNQAQAPAHTVFVHGSIGADLALRLDTYGDGIPFHFIDGDSPSGLSLGEAEYSNDGGLSWGYLPVSGAGGAPSGFDATVTHWRIGMVGIMNPKSSFSVEYQAVLPTQAASQPDS